MHMASYFSGEQVSARLLPAARPRKYASYFRRWAIIDFGGIASKMRRPLRLCRPLSVISLYRFGLHLLIYSMNTYFYAISSAWKFLEPLRIAPTMELSGLIHETIRLSISFCLSPQEFHRFRRHFCDEAFAYSAIELLLAFNNMIAVLSDTLWRLHHWAESLISSGYRYRIISCKVIDKFLYFSDTFQLPTLAFIYHSSKEPHWFVTIFMETPCARRSRTWFSMLDLKTLLTASR